MKSGTVISNSSSFVFVSSGYRNDVIEKWASSNPGILSRFPLEVIFEDFNFDELRTIFIDLVAKSMWHIENYTPEGSTAPPVDVATAVARRLVKGAGRVGFANARSVRITFEKMQRAASTRQQQEKKVKSSLPPNSSTTLTLIDLIGHPFDMSTSPLVKDLMAMTGLDDVKKSVLSLLKMTSKNYESELSGGITSDVPLHRMFLGNPGTGKTSIAKIYGKILAELGYLTNGEVIVVGASKLVGAAVGSTSTIVNNLIDSVKGKVLVIDEAYVLGDGSIYGKEALDILVERVQGVPGENFAVIMCGYEDEMNAMMRECNPGLKRRFQADNAFMFADYNDDELATIMVKKASDIGFKVTRELAMSCVRNVLAQQRAKPNFGNAGSVDVLLNTAKLKMCSRYVCIMSKWDDV